MDMTLVQRFDLYLQKYGISNNKAAAGIGYTPSVLSQWRKGDYKGDIDTVESKIRSWLDLQEAREKGGAIPFIPLRRTARIKNVVRIAHEEKFIGLILGNSGTGKSRAIEEYAAENPSTHLLIKCDPTMGLSTVVTNLAREIGLDTKGRISEISDRFVQELRKRDMVVIFDEADYLSDQVLEWARIAINDKGGAAMVLAGMPRLEYRIKSLKGDHRQIENRVGMLLKIEDLGPSELHEVLGTVWPEIFTIEGSDTIAKIFEATARGSLHLLVRHIALVRRALRAGDGAQLLNADMVKDAALMLFK